ncbi:hypothetical protein DSCW_33150 [Desulfosarcina widdelii]|uniref:BD-FAE-like domain-containing protein n=1 Tax=Desulfosarcina widdelii TaxID=947919 RepID=A0A5K7Z4H7_9BACT|nr:alpha/beta hydrolase [Desulfosarcina widdelii]BBO75898.1 hypothetical protein DSCW_33150 [Desulfosarcina widdelii]
MSQRMIHEPKSGKAIRVLDVTYRQSTDGTWPARIYRPEQQGPLPALLDVHGGAWTVGGHTDNEMVDLYLAASGLVVFAVECRKAPRHTYPSQVADVNYATRWVKAHAGDFNASSNGIGGLGTSSGGHSLLLSAMRPDDARYQELDLPGEEAPDARLSYLIAAWPVLDPHGRYLFSKENQREFLVEATDAYFLNQEAMQEGNPLRALERGESLDLPPVMIIQGTADNNVPLDAVDRFVDAYRKAGGMIELAWFPDMPHGFASKPGTETDHALEIMRDFVYRQHNRPAGI